jgi:L-ribulose-5-phosphate 3-epimerase/hexulose-6-phosphate isomerase
LYEKAMPDDLPLGEKLLAAKAAGYDYLELSIDESDERLERLNWSDKELNALKAAQEVAALPILSVCLSGHRRFPLGDPEPETRRASLDIMEKSLRLASLVGARMIQLAGYDVYYKPSTGETEGYFARGLERAVEMAACRGIFLGLETMETPFMDTVSKAMRWVEQIKSPYLQIYPDTGNLTNSAIVSGQSALDDLDSGRGHLLALHLKESLPGVYRNLPYGAGHVDFAALSAKALESGVRLFVAEFWHRDGDWRSVIAENCRFLRDVLRSASASL